MSRAPVDKNTLSLTTVAEINKRFPKAYEFWRKHLDYQVMSVSVFYAAMRGDPVSVSNVEAIEQAVNDMCISDALLDRESVLLPRLAKVIRGWWLMASVENVDAHGHPVREAISSKLDPLRDALVGLGILNAFGYPVDLKEPT